MPELPDITVYLAALEPRVLGQPLERARLASPFLLRSVDPPLTAAEGQRVVGLRRIGKRIVFALEQELFLVFHLMIAGRFRWLPPGAPPNKKIPGRIGLAAFDFPTGTLALTEASSKKRAALHVVRGEAGLGAFDRGGIDVFSADATAFRGALLRERHTLKRTLTDPRLLDGIGNAYSDEILHRAQLSPVKLTSALGEPEIDRLQRACRDVLAEWTARLRQEVGDGFPEKVTAFRAEMAVHGRYRKPCPRCGAPVQRIVYAENETNYCAPCQTGGKLLADRALSRLLHGDWPRTLEELEERKAALRESSAPASAPPAMPASGKGPRKKR
jgi:formamidopyrimidine-DNA glycosylase